MNQEAEEYKIGLKIEDMMLYAYPVIRQFPKSEKFTLGTDIRNLMDEILGYAVAARKKYTKKTTLEYLDIANEKLQVYIRIANRLHIISDHTYGVWSGYCVEIGKMIGGWMKTVSYKSQS